MEGQWINIMKNKIAAILLCLGVAISTLCACSSTGNGGDQPAEETTTKQTEAVTEAPTTEEISESETTTTVEPTDTQSGDVIIPLYDYIYADQIRQMSPESVASDFYNTIAPYMVLGTVTEDSNMTVYRLTIDGVPQTSFTLGNTGNNATEVEVYLCISTAGVSTTSFNTSTDNSSIDFIPLFYNETKKCLVGYSGYNSSNPGFSEAYWDNVLRTTITVPVDPSLYGL